jgi:REP element-mobilizing transposase RayT
MSEFVYKERTARRLPHFHPPDSILFVTFRLAGTIPKSMLRLYNEHKDWFASETKRIERLKLKADSPEIQAHSNKLREFHRQWFRKFEDILHKAETGPTWLGDDRVAEIVADALHYRDGNILRLDCYCIMPNHVHVVFAPYLSERELREIRSPESLAFMSKNPPLDAIMKSLKGYTAWEANRVLGRKGTFWERESYDHVVRDDAEYDRILKYVLNNPVKAGLVKDWRQWKWSYRRQVHGCNEEA